jgi:hypothetical protein
MQAYQSPPCPYCGITWNQPGAQACANCRNPLPPSYTPPGYPQQNYPQQPQYPGPPPGYPGQPSQGYPNYGPPGYQQQPGAYGPDQGYGAYGPQGQPASAGTTLRLFGQTFTLPVALPPALLQFQRYVRRVVAVAVGLLVLLVLFVGILPAAASIILSNANQALKLTASRQDKIDTLFKQAFNVRANPSDPNVAKGQFDKVAKSLNDGLSLVQSDEAALVSTDQRLTFLQWVVPSKGAEITATRHRLDAATLGLKQADQALTTAVNEAKVIQPYLDALSDYTKINAALAKNDLVGAGAPYPEAQQKIELAISNSHAAGVPPQLAKQVSSFSDVLTNTESLIQAIQAKDAAGKKKYMDAMNAAFKAMSSPEETVPADYETKTFGPMQKAYDAAMKAIKSGS